jgi:non-specific serine/threonine protein kinase
VARGRAGDPAAATEALRDCLSLTEPLGEHQLRSAALAMLGVQALRQRDTAGAEHAGRESLRSATALGDEFATACALTVLGCAATADDAQRAAILVGAADRRWRALGSAAAVAPSVALVHNEAVRLLRDQLGATRFAAATRRGIELGDEVALRFAIDGVLEDRDAPAREGADAGPLTVRELEVAELVAKGLSNKDIAEVLVISPRTAQGHVENILRKLGLTSRTQVAAWVLERSSHPTGA